MERLRAPPNFLNKGWFSNTACISTTLGLGKNRYHHSQRFGCTKTRLELKITGIVADFYADDRETKLVPDTRMILRHSKVEN